MRVSLTTLLIVSFCVGASIARADLIGVEPLSPKVSVPEIKVDYKGQQGTFQAKSLPPQVTVGFSPDGTNWYSGLGSFNLIMQLNSDDGTLISGSMEFSTTTGEAGFPLNARIEAELEEFGYDLEMDMLDFHFVNTAAVGDSVNPFAGGSGVLDISLIVGGPDSKPWPEDFTRSWSNQEQGTAEVGIPEPSTIALLALGAIGLIRRRRRTR